MGGGGETCGLSYAGVRKRALVLSRAIARLLPWCRSTEFQITVVMRFGHGSGNLQHYYCGDTRGEVEWIMHLQWANHG